MKWCEASCDIRLCDENWGSVVPYIRLIALMRCPRQPDIKVSLLILGHAMSSCLPLAHLRILRQGMGRSVLRQVIASPVVHG